MAFENYGFDSLEVEQVSKSQSCRTGADDSDLCAEVGHEARKSGGELGKLLDHFLGDSLALHLGWITRQTHGPHAFLHTRYGQSFATEELVLHGEAAVSPIGHAGIDMHNISKRGRDKKVATGLHQWNACNLVVAQHLGFLNAQGAVKERVGTRVKIFKIAREKYDAKGIAIAPFNLYFFSMDEHSRWEKHPADVASAESIVDGFSLHAIWFSRVRLR